MEIQIVEPNKCIGYSSNVTNSSLAIASVLEPSDFHKFDIYDSLWVDSGVFELASYGTPLDWAKVLKKQCDLANTHIEMGATYFALPDEAGNGEETINLYERYFGRLKFALHKDIELVAIPQGKDLGEFQHCVDYFKDETETKWWGFSVLDRRWMYSVDSTGHSISEDGDIFELFLKLTGADAKSVHVLGFDLRDLQSKTFFKMNSFDTAYPLKSLMNKVALGEKSKRPEDYFTRELTQPEVERQVIEFKEFVFKNSE